MMKYDDMQQFAEWQRIVSYLAEAGCHRGRIERVGG